MKVVVAVLSAAGLIIPAMIVGKVGPFAPDTLQTEASATPSASPSASEAGRLVVYNQCDEGVRLYLYLRDFQGGADVVPYWDIPPHRFIEPAWRDVVIYPLDGRLMYYGASRSGREWKGRSVITFAGTKVPLIERILPADESGRYALAFCDGER